MALAEAIAGALRPSQVITWTDGDGDAMDLTGATLTGVLHNTRTGESRAIAGTLSVTDAAAGVFTWEYAAGDVLVGTYSVQFTASFASGITPARTIVETWRVRPALTAE